MRLPVASILLILVAGFCFGIFILFNYVLFTPGSGLVPMLNESAQNIMSGAWYSWFIDRVDTITIGFGFTGIICLGLAFVIFIADALSDPRSDL